MKNFPITALKLNYNGQFSKTLSHRDFLGAILGLGIDRGKVGDIIIKEEAAIIFVNSSMADFIITNMEKAGRSKVKLEKLDNVEELSAHMLQDEIRITVSSMRLDAVISEVFKISRSKSVDFIEGEKAFVNWICVTSPSKSVGEQNIITLRGVGRMKIQEIVGKTKKDKFLLHVIKY